MISPALVIEIIAASILCRRRLSLMPGLLSSLLVISFSLRFSLAFWCFGLLRHVNIEYDIAVIIIIVISWFSLLFLPLNATLRFIGYWYFTAISGFLHYFSFIIRLISFIIFLLDFNSFLSIIVLALFSHYWSLLFRWFHYAFAIIDVARPPLSSMTYAIEAFQLLIDYWQPKYYAAMAGRFRRHYFFLINNSRLRQSIFSLFFSFGWLHCRLYFFNYFTLPAEAEPFSSLIDY